MAVKLSTSNIPRLLMLNVVPLYSSLRSVPVWALEIRSLLSAAISTSVLFSHPLMPGTIRPLSNAIAMPMLTLAFI